MDLTLHQLLSALPACMGKHLLTLLVNQEVPVAPLGPSHHQRTRTRIKNEKNTLHSDRVFGGWQEEDAKEVNPCTLSLQSRGNI